MFPDDQYDTQRLIDQYGKLTEDIRKAYDLGQEVELPKILQIDHIYFMGMGGSAISGDFIKLYLQEKGVTTPFTVLRDYDLPAGITKQSLVICTSYSGNTEETISAYRQAIRLGCPVIAIEDGGKLEEIAKVNRHPYLLVPKGQQPRTAALSWLFFPALRILERLGVVSRVEHDIEQLVKGIQKPQYKELASQVSEKLVDTVPIIYSSTKYYPVAYRFKTQINENAKVHAFSNKYSEFNHNELVGYTKLKANYHIITFHFADDNKRIQKRMQIVKQITGEKGVETTEIKITGDHFLTKLFSAILIGDLTSYYLALRYKVDPSPVELIDSLKEQMGPFL